MPLYEYKCVECGVHVQIFRLVEERDVCPTCRECNGKTKRTLRTGGFSLKGKGWYKDGYSSS